MFLQYIINIVLILSLNFPTRTRKNVNPNFFTQLAHSLLESSIFICVFLVQTFSSQLLPYKIDSLLFPNFLALRYTPPASTPKIDSLIPRQSPLQNHLFSFKPLQPQHKSTSISFSYLFIKLKAHILIYIQLATTSFL